jgi:hypothetical protein
MIKRSPVDFLYVIVCLVGKGIEISLDYFEADGSPDFTAIQISKKDPFVEPFPVLKAISSKYPLFLGYNCFPLNKCYSKGTWSCGEQRSSLY